VWVAALFAPINCGLGEVITIGSEHLDSARVLARAKSEGRQTPGDRGLPRNSWIELLDTIGTPPAAGVVAVRLFTPWGRAARVAAAAVRGEVQLEEKIWNPAIYNVGVALIVEGWPVSEPGPIQIHEVVCLGEGVLLEPLWERIDTLRTTTADSLPPQTYYQGLFPPEFVNNAEDIQVFVSSSVADTVFLFRGQDLSKLR